MSQTQDVSHSSCPPLPACVSHAAWAAGLLTGEAAPTLAGTHTCFLEAKKEIDSSAECGLTALPRPHPPHRQWVHEARVFPGAPGSLGSPVRAALQQRPRSRWAGPAAGPRLPRKMQANSQMKGTPPEASAVPQAGAQDKPLQSKHQGSRPVPCGVRGALHSRT